MINCPICHKPAEKFLDKVKDYFILHGDSPDYEIIYCPNCAVAFSLPILSDQDLALSYPEEYEAYNTRKSFSGFLQILKYQSDLRLIKKKILKKENASLFEIGSGRGEFLAQAEKAGFKVEGIEPSPAGRRAAKKLFNLELRDGYASQIEFNKKYDVIVMRHVFEHVNQSVQVLEKIKSGLADGGIIFLKLPRLDSWEEKFFKKYWHGYDLPRHRFHYSSEGIAKILKNLGFSRVEVKREIVPSDIIRSLQYYNLSEHNFLSGLVKIYLILPDIIKIILGQIVAIILSPLKSGRMIVTAKYSAK